ncbi:uncharacterized protein METZ01_LOCUS504089, partial [marine metagenome]
PQNILRLPFIFPQTKVKKNNLVQNSNDSTGNGCVSL